MASTSGTLVEKFASGIANEQGKGTQRLLHWPTSSPGTITPLPLAPWLPLTFPHPSTFATSLRTILWHLSRCLVLSKQFPSWLTVILVDMRSLGLTMAGSKTPVGMIHLFSKLEKIGWGRFRQTRYFNATTMTLKRNRFSIYLPTFLPRLSHLSQSRIQHNHSTLRINQKMPTSGFSSVGMRLFWQWKPNRKKPQESEFPGAWARTPRATRTRKESDVPSTTQSRKKFKRTRHVSFEGDWTF